MRDIKVEILVKAIPWVLSKHEPLTWVPEFEARCSFIAAI